MSPDTQNDVSATPASHRDLKAGDHFERYIIEGRIGAGGQAVVYKATHRLGKRVAAIKILLASHTDSHDLRERMTQEGEALARIEHENIVRFYDGDILPDGSVWLAMEYVDGPPLSQVISRGPLPIGLALELAAQVADGMQAAHEMGVVHRDLKPANIIICGARAKVVDLGAAKMLVGDAKITQPGRAFFTPSHVSPEQAMGHVVTHRADIYSLGIVLYEMLTGKNPFLPRVAHLPPEERIHALLRLQLEQVPQAPSTMPPDVWAVVKQAIAKSPLDRFDSMLTFGRELRALSREYESDREAITSQILILSESKVPTRTSFARASDTPTRTRGARPHASKKPWFIGIGIGVGLAVGLLAAAALLPGKHSADATHMQANVSQSAPVVATPLSVNAAASPHAAKAPGPELAPASEAPSAEPAPSQPGADAGTQPPISIKRKVASPKPTAPTKPSRFY